VATEAGYRLRLRDVDADFFERWVQMPGAMLRPYAQEREGDQAEAKPVSESQSNILENRLAIVEWLKTLMPEGRRRLMSFLETASELVVITAADVATALAAYASTHKRGLRQETIDKIKIEIVGDLEPAARDRLANHWDECEARLGKQNLEDLIYLMTLNVAGTEKFSDLQEEALKRFNLPLESARFIEQRLVPSANAYHQILRQGETVGDFLGAGFRDRARTKALRSQLIALKRMSHADWRAPAIVALLTLKDDLVLLDRTLGGLERLAAAHMIVGVEPHAMLERYTALSRAIETRDNVRMQALLTVEANLKTRARNYLQAAGFATKSRFRTPVLLKLNDLLEDAALGIEPVEVTCEHILPRTPDPHESWRAAFRSADRRNYVGHNYCHRLGNVTVLSHLDNRKAGARPYEEKRAILQRSAFALSQAAASYAQWTPVTIERRGATLVNKLQVAWDL
jgi:hypothetical protein